MAQPLIPLFMENTPLRYFYKITSNAIITEFYDEITNGCVIHSSIKGIFHNNDLIVDYLFGIPNLFSKLNLELLPITYKTFMKNCYTHPLHAIIVLLQGIISGSNYDSKEFCDKYNEIILNTRILHLYSDIYNYFEKVLDKIAPFVETLCTCHRSDNIYATNDCKKFTRLDIIEKIIWETKLNDFNYFLNIEKKIKSIIVAPEVVNFKSTPINYFDEEMICNILDYFQHNNNPSIRFIYIYTVGIIGTYYEKRFISDYYIKYFRHEKLTVDCIKSPEYCFICEEYNIEKEYSIKPTEIIQTNSQTYDRILSHEYTIHKTKKPVIGFTCNKCKKKVIKDLDMKYNINAKNATFGLTNKSLINSTNQSKIKHRRSKHIMIIMANLFDLDSLFALFPADIIYHIILSIYWETFNAIPDEYLFPVENKSAFGRNLLKESLYVRDRGELLYSQYRNKFGVRAGKIDK